MSMSKKDYQLIADAISMSFPSRSDLDDTSDYTLKMRTQQWERMVHNITTALANDNERFNGSVFIAACCGVD